MCESVLPTMDPKAPHARCSQCPLKDQPCVQPTRASHARLAIVGDSPWRSEAEQGTLFVSETGRLLDSFLQKAGIPRGALHLTNAVLCAPLDGLTPEEWKSAITACAPRLRAELESLPTRQILAYGGKALKATLGKDAITHWAGAQHPAHEIGPDWHVVGSFHPSFALPHRNPWYKAVITNWTERAYKYACGAQSSYKRPEIVTTKDGEEKLLQAIARLHTAPELGTDVENKMSHTPKDFEEAITHLYNWGFASVDLGLAVSTTWYKISDVVKEALVSLGRSKIPKALHNGSHDAIVLHRNGLPLEGYDTDTMVMNWITCPKQKHDLGHVAAVFTEGPRWKDEFKEGKSNPFEEATEESRDVYNALDCYNQALIAVEQRKYLTPRTRAVYERVMKAWLIGVKMRKRGIGIDKVALEHVRGPLQSALTEAENTLKTLAAESGEETFECTNNNHIRAMFRRLKVPTRYRTPKGAPSYNSEALTDISNREGGSHVGKLARAVLRDREVRRLWQYVSDPPIWSDGCVHGDWWMGFADTLRASCKGIPLQTIPSGKKGDVALSRGIRSMYGPTRPGNQIYLADFSQQEMRGCAIRSGEPELMRCYREGVNVYSFIGSKIFGLPMSECAKHGSTESKRRYNFSKIASLAFIYGAEPSTVWNSMLPDFPNLKLLAVMRAHAAFFQAFPRVWRTLEEVKQKVIKTGEIEGIYGHKRVFFGKCGPHEINVGRNFWNQNMGAELMIQGMCVVDKELNWEDEGILLQVHDELVLEGPIGSQSRMLSLLDHLEREICYEDRKMYMPVEKAYGPNWGETKAA